MEQENKELDGTPLTFDEILQDKTYQSEFDKRVAKSLETAKTKWEKEYNEKLEAEKTEAEKLAQMKEEEKHAYELEQANKKAEEAINKLNAYELKEQAINIAQEKGLDISLLDDIDYSSQTAETIKTIIDTKKQVFDKALEKAINERYKEKTPNNVNGNVDENNWETSSKQELNPLFRKY